MTATTPRSNITRLITEPSLSDLVGELAAAENALASAREAAKAKRDSIADLRQDITARMLREGIDSFTDHRTGTRLSIPLRRAIEVIDEDRVFAALKQRGRLAGCTRLDVRAVRKEARSAPLEGTTEVATRRLQVRHTKGA